MSLRAAGSIASAALMANSTRRRSRPECRQRLDRWLHREDGQHVDHRPGHRLLRRHGQLGVEFGRISFC